MPQGTARYVAPVQGARFVPAEPAVCGFVRAALIDHFHWWAYGRCGWSYDFEDNPRYPGLTVDELQRQVAIYNVFFSQREILYGLRLLKEQSFCAPSDPKRENEWRMDMPYFQVMLARGRKELGPCTDIDLEYEDESARPSAPTSVRRFFQGPPLVRPSDKPCYPATLPKEYANPLKWRCLSWIDAPSIIREYVWFCNKELERPVTRDELKQVLRHYGHAKSNKWLALDVKSLIRIGAIVNTGSDRKHAYVHAHYTNAEWVPRPKPVCKQASTPVHSLVIPQPTMRRVYCDGKIVKLSDGWGMQCTGLEHPAQLLPGLSGAAVPDLSAYEGTVLSLNGHMEAAPGNVEQPRIHLTDLYKPELDVVISPLWAVFSGNLGNPPELNPKGDRFVGSLAFMTNPTAGDEGTSWLRLATYTYYAAADTFQALPKGEPVLVHGYIESYTYNDKARMQLAVRGLERMPRAAGNAPKPPEVLFRAQGDADPQADAFTDAA